MPDIAIRQATFDDRLGELRFTLEHVCGLLEASLLAVGDLSDSDTLLVIDEVRRDNDQVQTGCADAKREAMAATLPPVYEGPAPLSEWQTITVTLYVPTHGRCDQHATVIDGQRVAAMIRKRPSDAALADMWRDDLEAAREAMRASSSAG